MHDELSVRCGFAVSLESLRTEQNMKDSTDRIGRSGLSARRGSPYVQNPGDCGESMRGLLQSEICQIVV